MNMLIELLNAFDIGHYFGWYGLTLPIIEEICRYNNENPEKKIYIRQIKQKWGRLVIYTSERPVFIQKMILKAKYESAHICELCGARGKTYNMSGCVKTLCDEHLKAIQKARKSKKTEKQLYMEILDIEKYLDKLSRLEVQNEE